MDLLFEFIENELNIKLTSDKQEQFLNFEKFLLEWNQKINLVSRKTTTIEKHIIDSVFFLKAKRFNESDKIADIGTGGGFPGIPLKILFPNNDFVLFDSVGKKIMVVNYIIEKLKLKKIKGIAARAEEISILPAHKNKFNYVVSKAVAPAVKLYEYGVNFLKQSDKILCIKGGDLSEETAQLLKKYKNINFQITEFNFPEKYNLTDKKLLTISDL
ncbi:MAG TPA: 16S rRNA (guanine(527)-N(7))-methyltransferase RsmG [Ignavibacteria bacterium]|nr:16S rRNA (guanine(527)-N(7))-methyltransferase RsmG [Ignavibacteria bacterium]